MLFICGGGQLSNFECPDLFAVCWETVLGKAEELAVIKQEPSAGPRDSRVGRDQGTHGMLDPGGSQTGGRVQRERVMLMRIRTGKEPPFFVEADERRVGVRSANEISNVRPLAGKGSSAIKADGAGAQRLRNHVEVIVPLKDVRIREMKRLRQNNLPVLPGKGIVAGGKADLSQAGAMVQDLKEHMPEAVHLQHEWVGDKAGGNVSDIARGKHWITDAGSGREVQRRSSGIDADGPDPGRGSVR